MALRYSSRIFWRLSTGDEDVGTVFETTTLPQESLGGQTSALTPYVRSMTSTGFGNEFVRESTPSGQPADSPEFFDELLFPENNTIDGGNTTPNERDYTNSWLLWVPDVADKAELQRIGLTGFVSRVLGYDTARSTFFLEELPGLSYGRNTVDGDLARMYHPEFVHRGPQSTNDATIDASMPQTTQGLFNVTAQMCADGAVLHRCVFWQHQSGGTGADADRQFDNYRVFLEDIDTGDCTIDICAAGTDDPGGASHAVNVVPSIALETDEPDLSDFTSAGVGGTFTHPTSYENSDQPGNDPNVPGTTIRRAMWIRLTIPAGAAPKSTHCVKMTIEGQNSGGDTVQAMMPIVWSIPGFARDFTFGKDRTVYVGGGAKIKVTAKVSATQDPVVGLGVKWSIRDLRSPEGVSVGQLIVPADPVTDENGESIVTYVAPTDSAAADQTGPHIEIEAKL